MGKTFPLSRVLPMMLLAMYFLSYLVFERVKASPVNLREESKDMLEQGRDRRKEGNGERERESRGLEETGWGWEI